MHLTQFWRFTIAVNLLALLAGGVRGEAMAQRSPMTEHARDLPSDYLRTTVWKEGDGGWALVSAFDLSRKGPNETPPPSEPVSLSATALDVAQALLRADRVAQELLRFQTGAHQNPQTTTRVIPPNVMWLPSDTAHGHLAYVVRRTYNNAQRVTTTVKEQNGRLTYLMSKVESRDEANWWLEAMIVRTFDSIGVQSAMVSQYPKPKD